jgi:hypothetical protein
MNEVPPYEETQAIIFEYSGEESRDFIKQTLVILFTNNGYTKMQALTLANELIKKVKQ